MNWLDSMKRGREKRRGDGEFKTLKSLHGKLKGMEREGVRGVMVAEVEIVESLNLKN